MTNRRAKVVADGRVLTVHIPFQIKKRGGCKLVISPDGASWSAPRPRIDSTLVKALARAHRWKRLLESGRFASVADLAAAEKIDRSFLCRTLRLTLLAPDIVEAILNGRQPAAMQLEDLLDSPPPGVGGAKGQRWAYGLKFVDQNPAPRSSPQRRRFNCPEATMPGMHREPQTLQSAPRCQY